MLNWLYILVFACCPLVVEAQDSLSWEWTKTGTFPLDSNAMWNVDQLNNVYVTRRGSIEKYDSTGTLKFQQSIKSYGKTKQLLMVNSMKLVHFSEEQQTLCFLDNTLTASEDCIDLTDYEIYNAEWVAASSRPEFLWVYDNVNSTLKLISLQKKTDQQIEISNVKGLLGMEEIDQIVEESAYLYLLEAGSKMYKLDFYGGLLQTYPAENTRQIDVDRSNGNTLYSLKQKKLAFSSLRSGQNNLEGNIDLPASDILQFKVIGHFVYLRTAKNVHKYSLHFKG